MLPDPERDALELGLAALRIDHDMAELVGERDEIALGIDHRLLYERRALFEKAAQQMRFARTGIALDKQTRRQQFGEIEQGWLAAPGGPHVDGRRHAVVASP
jgi:hypothetical protein